MDYWTLVCSKGRFYICFEFGGKARKTDYIEKEKQFTNKLYHSFPHIFAKLEKIELDQNLNIRYEYFPSGDLQSLIRSGETKKFSLLETLKIAYGVAFAIKVLENNALYHPCLTDRFIFIDENTEPHIVNYTFMPEEKHHSIRDNIIEFGYILEKLENDKNDKVTSLSHLCKNSNTSIDHIISKIKIIENDLIETENQIFNDYVYIIESGSNSAPHNSMINLLKAFKNGNLHAKNVIEQMIDMEYIDPNKKYLIHHTNTP